MGRPKSLFANDNDNNENEMTIVIIALVTERDREELIQGLGDLGSEGELIVTHSCH